MIAQGGRFGGWSLYAKGGKAKFVYNVLGIKSYDVESTQPIPAGKTQVRMEFAYDGGGPGKGGNVTLYCDGKAVGKGRVDQTQGFVFSADETTDIGYESGTTVSPDYTAHTSRFNGKINWVQIDLGQGRQGRRSLHRSPTSDCASRWRGSNHRVHVPVRSRQATLPRSDRSGRNHAWFATWHPESSNKVSQMSVSQLESGHREGERSEGQFMTARSLKTMLARSVLAGLAAIGLIACGSREPATDAERLARGRELVEQMSAKLAAAAAVSAATTEARDIVRFSGKKETISQTAVYTVRRPDRFYSKMTGGRGLETWYNGKTLTIAAHPDKVFAQAPMPETIDRTLDAIAERYDMALPMGDLFYSSAAKALLSDTTTGGYVGKENVGNTPAVHLAFKDTGVDWDVWLPEQGDPLPLRLKIVQKSRRGQPAVDLTFTSWDLAAKVTDATFVPKVPADYEGIAIVQRAAAVKAAAARASGGPTAPAKK